MRAKDYSRTLFVCTGNVFRSATAEKIFAKRAEELQLDYQARSRGIQLYFDSPNPYLVEVARRTCSVVLDNHKPETLSKEDVEWASIIICFTDEHRESILRMNSSARLKTHLFAEISFLSPELFQDINYYAISEKTPELLKTLDALIVAVDRCFKSETLSIILSVHNEEKNIGRLLVKLMQQCESHQLTEIIVVSSGSTDRTNSIVESLGSDSIILIKESERRGKVNALKTAIEVASGRHVVLLDGDVNIEEYFLHCCFECIYANVLPCTGRIIPIQSRSAFYNELALLSCHAWNNLRKHCSPGDYLYPSGYVMIISKTDFSLALTKMSDLTINDDALLSIILFQERIVFKYCPKLSIGVLFPQTLTDYFRQKIRTRMGRRQFHTTFFRAIEAQWRSEVIKLADRHNFLYIFTVLTLDLLSRGMATFKIMTMQSPHLWPPALSTKDLPLE